MNRMAIIELARSFLRKEIGALEFSEEICIERRALYGVKDQDRSVMNCGEELFMVAEVYNPDLDRADYELDDAGLRAAVITTLEKFNFI